ncbi:MAG: peroxiredoxin family protein [Candidatus Entotheonellia bacterium]
MRGIRRVDQPVCLFLIAVMALLLGSALGVVTGDPVRPPMGLVEVKPTAPMPMFTLPGITGETFDWSTLQGKVVVMWFWATW